MKKIICSLLLLFVFTSAKSAEITEVTLTVNGQGKTKEEAKFYALRNAIENAFGAFISSNTSVINDELAKDEITSISSGNIKKINVLSEIQLPNGTYTTLINATVSLSKLNDLCKNKGVVSDFSGELFAMNIKMQKFKKENELKIILNLISTINIISKSLFDYKIEVSKPKEYSGGSGRNKGLWDIPISIHATVNKNSNTIEDIFTKTIKEISVKNNEEQDLIESNQKVYPITIDGKIYKLRNYDSYKEVHHTFITMPFCAFNFILSNGLESNTFAQIRECFLKNNLTLCGFTRSGNIEISNFFYDLSPRGHSMGMEISSIIGSNKYFSLNDMMNSRELLEDLISSYSVVNLIINFNDLHKWGFNITFNNTLPLDKIQKISKYKIEPIISK